MHRRWEQFLATFTAQHISQHICIPLRLVFVHHRALHSHAAAVCILEQHLNIDNRTAGVSHVTRHRPKRPNPAPNSGTKSRLRSVSFPTVVRFPLLQCTSKRTEWVNCKLCFKAHAEDDHLQQCAVSCEASCGFKGPCQRVSAGEGELKSSSGPKNTGTGDCCIPRKR